MYVEIPFFEDDERSHVEDAIERHDVRDCVVDIDLTGLFSSGRVALQPIWIRSRFGFQQLGCPNHLFAVQAGEEMAEG